MKAKEHARKMLVKRNHPLLNAEKPSKPEPAVKEPEKAPEAAVVSETEKPVAAKKKAAKKGSDDTVD